MTGKINHEWTRHARLRIGEAAYAASAARIAVEDNGAHVWSDQHTEIENAIRDLEAIKAVIEKRIAEESVIVRKAAA